MKLLMAYKNIGVFEPAVLSYFRISFKFNAPVAQLDRASAYGAEGWGFDSLQAHKYRHLFYRYNQGGCLMIT